MLIHELAAGLMDTSGALLSLGTVEFLDRGTGLKTTVFADPEFETSLANPATLNSSGALLAYSRNSAALKIKAYTAAGTLAYTLEEVESPLITNKIKPTPAAGDNSTDGDVFDQANLSSLLAAWLTSAGGRNWYYLSARTSAVARTLKAKLGTVVDVRDFNAKGDDSSDDTAAFIAAIAAVPAAGGSVFVPAGTYRITAVLTLSARTNVSFFGEGMASVIKATTGAFTLFDLTGSCSDIAFDGLQLQGGGSTGSTAGIGISMGASVNRLRLRDCKFSGPTDGTGFNKSVYLVGNSVWLDNCYFERAYAGSATTGYHVELAGADDVWMGGCEWHCQDSLGGQARNAIITTAASSRVRVHGPRILQASAAGIDFSNCDESSVQGGHISSCGGAGVRLDLADHSAVNGTYIDACAYGVASFQVSAGVSGGCSSCTVNACRIYNCTNAAVHLAGASNATPAGANVTNASITANILERCKRGVYLSAGVDCLIANNHVLNCSDNVATYAGIVVTTVGTTSGTGGGLRNNIVGNTFRETAGSYVHLVCIDCTDSGGGSVNMNTNVILGNVLRWQNAAGTPASVRTAGVLNLGTDPTTMGLNTYGPLNDTGGGLRMAINTYAGGAGFNVTNAESGITYLVNTDGGATNVTLPDLGADSTTSFYNGWWLRIVKAGTNANALTITCSGTNNIQWDAGGAPVAAINTTGVLATNFGASVLLVYYNGTFYAFPSPLPASCGWS